MRLLENETNWLRYQYRIFGIKISKKKTRPSHMNLNRRIQALKKLFYDKVGYPLDVENPQTFNEKINWLKLFYRNGLMTRIVDKYEFKNYIKEQLGEGYTVPLLGVWEHVEDIDFTNLPNKFVLKCNAQSDSKFIKIVKDKNELDIKALKLEMQEWLRPENTLKTSFCWAYHDVPLRIIAEKYIEQIDGQVYDYKFMCFNGEPKFVLACSDRGKHTVYENHNMDWGLIVPSPKSARKSTISCPKNYDKMIEIARELAKEFPFVRVDFYEIENKILLGELTFYPNGGFNTYKPYWDKKFGDYLKLPEISIKIKHPFIEKVKYKNKHTIKIFGKKFITYHKSLSRKQLTNKIIQLNDSFTFAKADLKYANEELKILRDNLDSKNAELKSLRDNLYAINKELKIAEFDIKNLKQELDSRPKLRPSRMRLEERVESLKYTFFKETGYPLNLINPQTFNEKINWLKLFYRNDLMTRIVDKYEFKNYIKEKLGEGYTIPLIGAWDTVDDIDFNNLPNKFVLKSNVQSDSKFIKVVRDKNELDIDALKVEMQDWLDPDKTLKTSYCWAYYNVPIKIIAEEYLETCDDDLYDYKFFCFHGEPKFIEVIKERYSGNYKASFYSLNWNMLDLQIKGHQNAEFKKPVLFDDMLNISRKLSAEFPQVRVDFYFTDNKIYVGEMTFYSGGGYFKFKPTDWDKTFGDMLDMSKIPQEHLLLL